MSPDKTAAFPAFVLAVRTEEELAGQGVLQ